MIRLPRVYHHPSPRETLLPHLLPLLPHSLPIVRRIQFRLQSPHSVVLSTLPPTTEEKEETPNRNSIGRQQENNEEQGQGQAQSQSQSPLTLPHFSATYTDRSRSPETETWVFSTIELPTSSTTPESLAFARLQLLALFSHISTLPHPPQPQTPSNPSILLVGSIHASVLALLKGVDVQDVIGDASGEKVISGDKAIDHVHGSANPNNPGAGGVIRGHTVSYTKFIIPPYTDEQAMTFRKEDDGFLADLGLGLTWGTVHPQDLPLVISRTDIPRKARTLELLPSFAIRKASSSDLHGTSHSSEGSKATEDDEDSCSSEDPSSNPIAWSFLSPDASLCSLHVEPSYRKRGLAKKLARQTFAGLLDDRHLLKREEPAFHGLSREQAYGHSDVSHDNVGSIAVAKAVGGKPGWECFWGWVDLDAVYREIGEMGL